MNDATPLLRVDGLERSFGALKAVDGVSLSVAPGERRAIIGPNGAGKTTLFTLLSGELRPTAGRVFFAGREVTRMAAPRRVYLGLGRTYQITNVFGGLTVEENVVLAAQGTSPRKFSLFGGARPRAELAAVVDRSLETCGLAELRDVRVGELSYGVQRQLEIAIALATRPRLILFDEPAAGLSPAERTKIAALVRALPRDITIVLIEHDMDLALGLVDRVTCLHYGRVLVEDSPEAIRCNAQVQEVYLGTPSTGVGAGHA